MTRLKFWFAFVLLFSSGLHAQSLDTKGTEFWVAFMDSYVQVGSLELSFFISSDEDTEVTIEAPGIGLVDTVSLDAGIAQKYVLPSSLETTVFDTIVGNGVKVSSDIEITLYGLSRTLFITDAYLGLPIDTIGSDYIVMTFGGSLLDFLRSEYLILATQDNTVVNITPSAFDDSMTEPFQIILNEGQVYQHRSNDGGDVTGTIISSNHAISVFGGHQCANIPDPTYSFCDHLTEQLTPTNTWGTSFVTSPLASRTGGDTFRFIASEDATTVMVDGFDPVFLNRGEFAELLLTDASLINSDKPILLAQFSNSTSFDSVVADPFMVLVPPFEQFLDSYTFLTPTVGFRDNFVNVVTRTSDIENLQFNGEPVSTDSFSQIGTTSFSFAQLPSALGSNTIGGALAGITIYGYDTDDSYGYPGGLSLSSVAEVENVTLAGNYEIVNDQACFSARVSDINELPIEFVRVDFIVDLLEGFGISDGAGVAEFCVENTGDPGSFLVTAKVGVVTQQVVVTEAEVLSEEVQRDNNDSSDSGGGSVSYSLLFLIATILGMYRIYLIASLRTRSRFK